MNRIGGPVYSGLICAKAICELKEDDSNSHATVAALLTSSSTGNTTQGGGPSVVLVMVGFLGAVMLALKVASRRRHRGLRSK